MIIIYGVLVSIGLYLILADIFKISKLKTSKTILNANKRMKKKTSKSIEVIFLDLATKLSKYIKLTDYKKDKLEMTLKSAQIKVSPETYIADVYIKTGIALLVSAITFLINPFISILFFLLAILIYIKEYNKAEYILTKRKTHIESELPKLTMNISQELKLSRDVLKMLENYQKNSHDTPLSQELEITIADMRSGSYEQALKRFETRMCSSNLSEVIRGLIGVLNGNDEVLYFRMLAKNLNELQFQRLKGIAMKRPSKVKKYSAMMLTCMLLMYGVILGYEIVNGLSNMF
ncbi:MAG: secretion protein F [Clostridium sp.]|uniref:secretion protein F n=1 Tax=Clostridium sp. TaxID=1506 RepID=UPI001F37A104|nr:secretion protein F [Clostridium sp.]MDU7089588.1 secretion protein F [Clostridium sp.]